MPYRGKSSNSMGSYSRSEEEDAAAVWGIQNNVCITPRQAVWGQPRWYIDIEKGAYPNRKLIGTSPETYGKDIIWEKISEYQTYYYKKYAK